jgi:hypothetical protein
MTQALCETVVHIIVLSRLTHYVKLLCWILHCHISHKIWNCRAFFCTFTIVQNVIQSRRTQDAKLLFTIIYSHDPHIKWSRYVEYCTVTNQRLCETFVQKIVLSRLTFDVKHLYIILYSHDSHMHWESDCCLAPIQQYYIYIMARTS